MVLGMMTTFMLVGMMMMMMEEGAGLGNDGYTGLYKDAMLGLQDSHSDFVPIKYIVRRSAAFSIFGKLLPIISTFKPFVKFRFSHSYPHFCPELFL